MIDRPTDAWNDDRLDAAFIARDRSRPSPAALIEPTLTDLAAVRRPTAVRWVPRLHPSFGLLAVVIVIAVVGSISFASQRNPVGRPTVMDAPGPVATDRSAATPTAGSDTALGLPIITIEDAIAVRDGGIDDREIAVRGWFRPVTVSMFCAIILKQIRPVQFGCGDQFEWLTEDPIPFGSTTDANGTFLPPKGPAIHPSFDQLGRGWRATLPAFSGRCGPRPTCPPDLGSVSMVAIGHFDDRRAALCDANVRAQCADRFVVDRIDTIDGQRQRLSVVDDADGDRVWTMQDIDRLDPLGPGESRLSVQVFLGGEEALTLTPVAEDRVRQPAVWLIRDLIDGRAVTRAIADGSSEVDQILPDGSTMVLHAAAVTSGSPWPPADAIIVARSPTDDPRQFVAVVDQTGHLVDATRTSVDGLPSHDMSRPSIWVESGGPRRVIVRWVGTTCARDSVLRIRPTSIVLDMHRSIGPCGSALSTWAVGLRFDQGVDAASLNALYTESVTIVD